MKRLIIFFILAILIGLNAFVFYLNNFAPGSSSVDSRTSIRIQGEHTCLQQKETDGPVTLECALGIKADDGSYYGLNMTALATTIAQELKTGDRIEVEGSLIPLEEGDPSWEKYDIKAIIFATNLFKI